MSDKKSILKVLSILVCLISIALIIFSTKNNIDKKNNEENFLKGCENYEMEDYIQALEYFDKVLKYNSLDEQAYLYKAKCCKEVNGKNEALSVAEYGYKLTGSDKISEYINELIVSDDTENQESRELLYAEDEDSDTSLSIDNNTSEYETYNVHPDIIVPDVTMPEKTETNININVDIDISIASHENTAANTETVITQIETEKNAPSTTEVITEAQTTEIPINTTPEIHTTIPETTIETTVETTQNDETTDTTETTNPDEKTYTKQEVDAIVNAIIKSILKMLHLQD